MANKRLIGRLDLKMEHLIKGIHLEGWRKVGSPGTHARKYYEDGIDELIFMDVVASLYGRNNLADIVRKAAEEVLIPLTVGGGIRGRDDVRALLKVGADKVAINTAATQQPEILRYISDTYGSQATVLSIEAKRKGRGMGWEAMTDNGRNHTGRDVIAWAEEAQRLGTGEILVTSIDQDGTKRGMDIELIAAISSAVDIPVVASGGIGEAAHVAAAFTKTRVSAVAIARALHYGDVVLSNLRSSLAAEGISVRGMETYS